MRNDIINTFDKKIFQHKDSESKTNEEKSEEKSEEELKKQINNTFTFIAEGINNDLFTKYFDFLKPSAMAKQLYEIILKDKKKNNMLVEEIKNRQSNLNNETKEMSKEEIGNEKPNQILEIINEILDFNKEIQEQRGLDLKILTPNQMLSRLPICLAQLKVGNNSQKLKKEITQLLHSLYRSKKLTKQLYKSLVDII